MTHRTITLCPTCNTTPPCQGCFATGTSPTGAPPYRKHWLGEQTPPTVLDQLMNDDPDLGLVFTREGMLRHVAHRIRLAKNGTALHLLAFDPSFSVRRIVAQHGEMLDELKDDPSWQVRREVAKHGQYLNMLADDDSPHVRAEVARQGHQLNRLVSDHSEIVRAAVASTGHFYDRLVTDRVKQVRDAAIAAH